MNASFFLIRTKQNQILGPVVKEDLVSRVLSGELETLDEICPASGYWVYLHEREEVRRLLGVELPVQRKARGPDDTDTETETETATVTATESAEASGRAASPKPIRITTEPHTVERPGVLKLLLYVFVAILVFTLLKIYELTQS